MRLTPTRILALCFAIALLLSAGLLFADPQPPFDPRPLLAERDPYGDGDFTFAVFGDSYARPPLANLLETVAFYSPTLVVTVGDMVAHGTEADNWKTLTQRAGPFFKAHPTFPVIGNHELSRDREIGLRSFLDYYALLSASYSFTFRNSRFIILDHQWPAAPDSQMQFLRQELADRDKYDHVFVFRHTPFYTVGSKSTEEVPKDGTELTKLLSDIKATAAFSGHDHSYYRTLRGGVAYITSGVAGAGVYELKRLDERLPGDSYMGVDEARKAIVLHVPGRPDRVVPVKDTSEDDWLFAVIVHVQGDKVTAKTVSMHGEVWEEFGL